VRGTLKGVKAQQVEGGQPCDLKCVSRMLCLCLCVRTCMVCSKRVLAYLIEDHMVHQGIHIRPIF
jgi:hypothetical protein